MDLVISKHSVEPGSTLCGQISILCVHEGAGLIMRAPTEGA